MADLWVCDECGGVDGCRSGCTCAGCVGAARDAARKALPDPWGLLLELMIAVENRDKYNVLPNAKILELAMRRADAALKQHDEEKA